MSVLWIELFTIFLCFYYNNLILHLHTITHYNSILWDSGNSFTYKQWCILKYEFRSCICTSLACRVHGIRKELVKKRFIRVIIS